MAVPVFQGEIKMIKYSYVLPDPDSYSNWLEFEGDLLCAKESGYDAVELQIPDPVLFDEKRVRESLGKVQLPMCAFQTGTTYGTRGNCLSTPDVSIRKRTEDLLRSFVDLAERWNSVIVFGSLQGRLKEEPNKILGESRIRESLVRIGEYATAKSVKLAFEPVNHGEIGFHNTIEVVSSLVREVNIPGIRMMVDSFHMNIEEKEMLTPLDGIKDILAHVHLSETNRDLLGTGHWDTKGFIKELNHIGYSGACSIGVYNTTQTRRESMKRCLQLIKQLGR